MTETTTIDRQKPKGSRLSRVKPAKRAASGSDAKIVSATAMASHLDLASRTYLAKMVADGIVEQLPDGRFDLDGVRIAYLRHLRTERRRSPGNAAAQEHMRTKTALLQQRLAQRDGRLIPKELFDEVIEGVTGAYLTALNSLPALVGQRDLVLRRRVEDIVRDVRVRLAEDFSKQAAKCAADIERHREDADE